MTEDEPPIADRVSAAAFSARAAAFSSELASSSNSWMAVGIIDTASMIHPAGPIPAIAARNEAAAPSAARPSAVVAPAAAVVTPMDAPVAAVLTPVADAFASDAAAAIFFALVFAV